MIAAPTRQVNMRRPIVEEAGWLISRALPPKLRTMREFAEQEVRIFTGPERPSSLFRCDTQPFTRLWLDQVERREYPRNFVGGPTQSGKTTLSFHLPLAYHLFEVGENIIVGVPDLQIAADKWSQSILPFIESTQYKDLLPKVGAGSRGGDKNYLYKFRHGPMLRFMTGGGGDKSRSHFPSRVLIVTETDGFDVVGGTSKEADKFTQLEARLSSFRQRRRALYAECTFTTKEGRTWQEIEHGTNSRIVLHCPKCKGWVMPAREHLRGWENCENSEDARDAAFWCCPACEQPWTEEDRRQANERAVLIHEGQEVTEEGRIVGTPKRTDTFGFRWTSVNNLFLPAGDIAAEEWKKRNAVDEENHEKKLAQVVHGIPYTAPHLDLEVIDPAGVCKRVTQHARGWVPPECTHLTAFLDIGKHRHHYVIMGWKAGKFDGHVVDYGTVDTRAEDVGEEQGIATALRIFRDDFCEPGWCVKRAAGEERMSPNLVLIDSGWGKHDILIHRFAKDSGRRYMASKGFGSGSENGNYRKPAKLDNKTIWIGDHCHVALLQDKPVQLVEFDADFWKSFLHRRITAPVGSPGSIVLFQVDNPREHLQFAKSIASEKQKQEFDPKNGLTLKWVKVSPNNHWLDGATGACVAASMVGVKLIEAAAAKPTTAASVSGGAPGPDGIEHGIRMPDGRPFVNMG